MKSVLFAFAQGGVPMAVWIILGIIVAIVGLVLAIKSFWVSKTISTLISIGGIVFTIMVMLNPENLIWKMVASGAIFTVAYVFLLGNAVFNSDTEGDYLIAGSLVSDVNHPFQAFCGFLGAIIGMAALIFWASYAWSLVIGLIAFILTLGLSVAMIIERIVS